MTSCRRLCLTLCAWLWLLPAAAEPLPPASRTVFKCEVDGKVSYSDAPCLGAQRLEVQPTRGLNNSTGRERLGADVQRERFREAFAEGLKPVTGMDAQQLQKAGQRARMSPQAERECRSLDRDLPAAEQQEAQLLSQPRSESRDRALKEKQAVLLALRQRARKLLC